MSIGLAYTHRVDHNLVRLLRDGRDDGAALLLLGSDVVEGTGADDGKDDDVA